MAEYVKPVRGEKHLVRMNYAGPGTKFYNRVRSKVRPMNLVDASAYVHDMWTELSGPHLCHHYSGGNSKVYKDMIQKADAKLINRCMIILKTNGSTLWEKERAAVIAVGMKGASLLKLKSHFVDNDTRIIDKGFAGLEKIRYMNELKSLLFYDKRLMLKGKLFD